METPSKKSMTIPQFSPVALSESPVKQTSQKGNLTGNGRVVRDLVADMYNWVQAWNQQHLDGYRILKNIADLKVPALKNMETNERKTIYPEGLSDLSDDLRNVCNGLSTTVTGMKLVAKQMTAVISLEKLHGRINTPLFLTWTCDKFGDICNQINSAYNQELEVKHCVASEISHCKSEPEVMIHLASWVYQPFISKIIERSLESMLIETDHR